MEERDVRDVQHAQADEHALKNIQSESFKGRDRLGDQLVNGRRRRWW
jgi:hypothetical protein